MCSLVLFYTPSKEWICRSVHTQSDLQTADEEEKIYVKMRTFQKMQNRIDPFWVWKYSDALHCENLCGPPTKQLRKLRCSITLADDVEDHGFGDIDDGDGSDGDGDDDVDENSSDGDRDIDDDDGDDLPINRWKSGLEHSLPLSWQEWNVTSFNIWYPNQPGKEVPTKNI